MTGRDEGALIGLPQAAERLGLHRATVNDMVHEGRIPARRIGPHWFIETGDLERFASDYRRPRNSPRRLPRAVKPSAEILALLGDWGSATAAELREVVDMHEGNIRKHLCIAEAQGLAERDEYSRWAVTAAGRRYATQTV
jgi:excisionase family DNA binding protein